MGKGGGKKCEFGAGVPEKKNKEKWCGGREKKNGRGSGGENRG